MTTPEAPTSGIAKFMKRTPIMAAEAAAEGMKITTRAAAVAEDITKAAVADVAAMEAMADAVAADGDTTMAAEAITTKTMVAITKTKAGTMAKGTITRTDAKSKGTTMDTNTMTNVVVTRRSNEELHLQEMERRNTTLLQRAEARTHRQLLRARTGSALAVCETPSLRAL